MTEGAVTDRAVIARFTALVLAGRRSADDPVARARGVTHKFLADVAGRPMLSRVLATLADSGAVGRIVVCTDDADIVAGLLPPGVETVAAAASPSRSILAAADVLGGDGPLLVTTADHPLLTAEMVDHFCRESFRSDADITVGLAPRRVIQPAYPETRRTYLNFRDDGYSGCNLFAVMRPQGLMAVRFWIRVEQERKRPWRMVKAFGPWTLLLFLTRRLTLAKGMRHASRILGARAAAIVMPFAEASMDVDKPDDLTMAERVLAARAAPPQPR